MIDIEDEIFNMIAIPLRAKYGATKIMISSMEVRAPSTFPYVELKIIDQNISLDHQYNQKQLETIVYQVDVYSNLVNKKKAQCKEIISFIDDLFISHNFVRTAYAGNTQSDATIYRITARYRVETDGTNLYRRNK